jgi:phosphoribosylanthranilate isomerase
MKNLIQIAGVLDQAEADLLISCGATQLGFPLRLPVHREDLTEAEAARIIQSLPGHVNGILITYLSEAPEIASLCRELGTSTVQLHGDISPAAMAELKSIAPDISIFKSLIVRTDNPADLLKMSGMYEPFTDAFILDSYDSATGACGATGRTHDWTISRAVAEAARRPVILAGGLSPRNVLEAVKTVKPAGVDVHTGVENKHGRKDRRLVEAFISEAQEGFAAI